MDAKTFFNTYLVSAQSVSNKTGIPALLILSQAALESGYGAHAPGNMFFGIKAGKTWTGKKQLLTTHEYFKTNTGHEFPEIISIVPSGKQFLYTVKDWFRAYDSPEESFLDHAKLLQTKNYAKVVSAKDTVSGARELQSAGYSTSPTYADSLIVVAHKMSPDVIPTADYASSLARVLGATAKKDAVAVAKVTTTPLGIVSISLAGLAGMLYFLGKAQTLGG
jgi:flagellar protein FlgJ